MTEQQDSGDRPIKVRRGRVDSLSLYEVTEDELLQLQQGGPASLMLNFALMSLSVAVSFFIALKTTEIKSDRTFMVFETVSIVGFAGFVILLILWIRNRVSVDDLARRIRRRMPEESGADLDSQRDDAVDKR